MTVLTWEELDQCSTADAVAELLRSRGVKGQRKKDSFCPLAVATGWRIGQNYRYPVNYPVKGCYVALTEAERTFIFLYDCRRNYADLVLED